MVSRPQDSRLDLNEPLVRPMVFASVPSSCKLQGLPFLSSAVVLNFSFNKEATKIKGEEDTSGVPSFCDDVGRLSLLKTLEREAPRGEGIDP